MLTIRIPLRAVKLDSQTVEALTAPLRPYVGRPAEEYLASIEARHRLSFLSEDRDEMLADAHAAVATAGRVVWQSWTLTATDGVEHAEQFAHDGVTPPSPELVDEVETASFVLRPYPYGSHPQVSISLTNGYGQAVVTAEDDVVRVLANRYREVFASYERAPEVVDVELPPFTVFIAYGASQAWEVIRDYLRRADFEVDAFIERERAGQVTIDVVSSMIHSASVAVIVMTAAEQVGDRSFARQNVVHEAGFAQAAIGVRNTIILVEEGVEVPSNLVSVTYIEFPRNGIHTVGDRVVNLVREIHADQEASESHGRRTRGVR